MSYTISIDEADDIVWGENLTRQWVSDHRWYTTELVVFSRHGALWGFYYLDPASEMQEDQDRYETDPVSIFPVTAREIVQTVYEPSA